ncbi:MAG TPA: TRAP transporter small permease subunit [Methylomirabilota bacterium]|nr:TRAP transporter small permease subunit [Methylomirabilota bacterium]
MVRAIDTLSTAAGWFAGALIAPLTLAVAYEVVARYVFNAPTRWVSHVTYTLYGAQFMLAAAYTLLKDGHIRTDVFYGRWSPGTRAIIDAVSYVAFFFPGMLLVLHAGTVEARHAWEIGERAGGWPAYPFKAIIPLTALLLLLQGLSELIKCARVLRARAR